MCVTYQGQRITRKYCGNADHVHSECNKGAIDSPPLTRSKPFESSTVVFFQTSYLSKKRKILQSELGKADSLSTTSLIKKRKQLSENCLPKPFKPLQMSLWQ